jgi:hypothetical protein
MRRAGIVDEAVEGATPPGVLERLLEPLDKRVERFRRGSIQLEGNRFRPRLWIAATTTRASLLRE